jgi:hypothetical protein
MVTVVLTALTLAFTVVSGWMFHRARVSHAGLPSVDMVFKQLRALYVSGATGLVGAVLGFVTAVSTGSFRTWPLTFALLSTGIAGFAVLMSASLRHQEHVYVEYEIDRMRRGVLPQKRWKWPKQ